MPVLKSCFPKSKDNSWLLEKLLKWSLLYLVMVLFSCADRVEMRPMEQEQPQLKKNFSELATARWINPCDLPGHLFDPTLDMIGAPRVDEREIANSVVVRTRITLTQAIKTRDVFINVLLNDPSLVDGTASHRLGWLPKVTRKDVQGKSIQTLCRYWYKVLQYYGVALEQVILDLTLYDGTLLPMCQEAENFLTQTLCQVHLASFMLRIRLDPDVTRDVMRQEYRVGTPSQRNLRNYIILRDYVEALELMVESFEEVSERTPLLNSTPFFTPLFENSRKRK